MIYQQTYYYRPSFYPRRLTALSWLLIVNAAVFVLQIIARPAFYAATGMAPERLLGLVPVLVWKRLFLWQLVTYMFLHGGFFHILFNMFTLWMFGREIEALWGEREFLKFYFLCGIGAGFVTVLLTWNSVIPTIGASGAIFGILLAYGLTFPDRQVYLYFFIPIKAKYLIWLFAGMELLASFSYTSDGIGHFAHLGGMLVGFLYLRGGRYLRGFRQPKRAKLKVIQTKPRRPGLDEEVDRILDKVSKQGINSLTPEERATLDEASASFGARKD